MKNYFFFFLILIITSSHELFLKTDSYLLDEDQATELYLYNGTFDESENIITRDRIVNAKILGPEYEFLPSEDHYYDKGLATYLKFTTGTSGTYIAGISTLPRNIDLSAVEFKDYLEHAGLTDMIATREVLGLAEKAAKEKYSKHVKAILQVGDNRSNHFNREFGYPIEFIPLDNPYDAKIGDAIKFKLISGGKILPEQVVQFGSRSITNNPGSSGGSARTDDEGIISIDLTSDGIWYLATIHMVETAEADLDYESNWATITFEVTRAD